MLLSHFDPVFWQPRECVLFVDQKDWSILPDVIDLDPVLDDGTEEGTAYVCIRHGGKGGDSSNVVDGEWSMQEMTDYLMYR